jgi:hypothetical protein
MKLIPLLAILFALPLNCSSPEAEANDSLGAPVKEVPPLSERSARAGEVMRAFGYQPEQFEAGEGMATIDDFSAPRISGGPAGYLIVSVDGEKERRRGSDPSVEYVPYVWLSAGPHELVLELRPEVSKELNRPEKIVLQVEVEAGINYRPQWNGTGLELVMW